MRHGKKRHKLGVSGPHRLALLANLSVALITHGRIKTTLSKAKALRPFVEKIITLAKKAESANEAERKLHFRRLAISRLRNPEAVSVLFDERVGEFMERPGGYTRIYKIGQRIGDATEMALIELIDGNDEGYPKKPSKKVSSTPAKKAVEETEEVVTNTEDETAVAAVDEEAAAEEPEEATEEGSTSDGADSEPSEETDETDEPSPEEQEKT